MFILYIIFVEKKEPAVAFAWVLFLLVCPIGFIIYVIFGNGLRLNVKRQIRRKKTTTSKYLECIDKFLDYKKYSNINYYKVTWQSLINFNKVNSNALVFENNQVEIFTNGKDFLKDLITELQKAKKSINIEYYIFADDKTGNQIKNILIEKAKQGVMINVLYDNLGSIKTKNSFFNDMKKSCINVTAFFPPVLFKKLNFKANYRNHRKIIVIDGIISYTGGINFRDDHMGLSKKYSSWRDTQIKIMGSGTIALQNIFLNDFNFAIKKPNITHNYIQTYFNNFDKIFGTSALQSISSGPEDNNTQIKDAMIKMISMAKSKIIIQTPYFIPDNIFLNSLIMAKQSGVDITLFIPKEPDKKTVYYCTLYYSKILLKYGINIKLYKGFIHSKMVVCDDVVMIGTANIDNRSFSLNFENSVIIYDKKIIKKIDNIINKDKENSEDLSLKTLKNKGLKYKFFETIMRYFSSVF